MLLLSTFVPTCISNAVQKFPVCHILLVCCAAAHEQALQLDLRGLYFYGEEGWEGREREGRGEGRVEGRKGEGEEREGEGLRHACLGDGRP